MMGGHADGVLFFIVFFSFFFSSLPTASAAFCAMPPGKCKGNPAELMHRGVIIERYYGKPLAVDWDGDGDLDLISGFKYYERVPGGALEERFGADSPFHDDDSWDVLEAVDWDGDGDLDLIARTPLPWFMDEDVQYFERVLGGALEERAGADSPFYGLLNLTPMAERRRAICFLQAVDWDGDGDLDLIVGQENVGPSSVMYFERVLGGALEARTGADNPFQDLDAAGVYCDTTRLGVTFPHAVDWDGDGDLDLIVGKQGEVTGKVEYFERVQGGALEVRAGADNPFQGLNVGYMKAVPQAVDWDRDGDLDLLVGDIVGNVYYFERVLGSALQEQGADSPFQGLDMGSASVSMDPYDPYQLYYDDRPHVHPQAVDWDGDGDLDLIVGNSFGEVKYFERVLGGALEERTGADSPFQGLLANGSNTQMAPHAVDWDGDGDLDLIVGHPSHGLQYFERVLGGALEERAGADSPFQGPEVSLARSWSPQAVDWDGDGDLDLIVRHSYFERVPGGALEERTGADSPLLAVQHWGLLCGPATPQPVDWDGDGDLDLIVVDCDGGVAYFERVLGGALEERTGTDSPFQGLHFSEAYLQAVDWDGDGDLDLIVGDRRGEVHYFERACVPSRVCSGKGLCNLLAGVCECVAGYDLADCSVCRDGAFCTRNCRAFLFEGVSRQCSSCPMSNGIVCGGRGPCWDDAWAQKQALDEGSSAPPQTLSGNGSCSCSEWFPGLDDGRTDCSGECPEGSIYEPASGPDGLASCTVCPSGAVVIDNKCECPEGYVPADGPTSDVAVVGCKACPPEATAQEGSCECPVTMSLQDNGAKCGCPPEANLSSGVCECRDGYVPADGLFSVVGCVACPPGAAAINNKCECPEGYVPTNGPTSDVAVVGCKACPPEATAQEGSCECPVTMSLQDNGTTCGCPLEAILSNGVCECRDGHVPADGLFSVVGCVACPPGAAAINNKCECPEGYVPADGQASDVAVVGCKACPPEATAQEGSCECPVTMSLQDNGTTCGCPPEAILSKGVCACPNSYVPADGLFSVVGCVACPPGAIALNDACDCPEGYVPADGPTSDVAVVGCKACPAESTSRDGTCECPATMIYLPDGSYCGCANGDVKRGEACAQCPIGGVCTNGTVVSAIAGYWLPAERDDAEPVKCPVGQGDTACSGNNTCSDGYAGMACSACSDAYGRLGSSCVPCTGAEVTFLIGILVFIAVPMALPFLMRFGPCARRADGGVLEKLAEGPDMTVIGYVRGFYRANLRNNPSLRVVRVQGRIIFLFLQACIGWTITLYKSYPNILNLDFDIYHNVVRQITSTFAFLAVPTQGRAGCVLSTEVYFLMQVAAMPVFLTLYIVSDMVCEYLVQRRVGGLSPQPWRARIGGTFFWVTYLTYTPLTVAIVAHLPIMGASFDCTLGDHCGCRLRLDYSVCQSSGMYRYIVQPAALVGFPLYAAGVPLWYCLALRTAVRKAWKKVPKTESCEQEKEWNDIVQKQAGTSWQSFFGDYRPSYWWFECVNMSRQCFLASVGFVAGDSAAAYIFFSICIACCYIGLLSACRPYAEESDNRAQLIATGALILIFSSQNTALSSQTPDGMSPQRHKINSMLLVLGNASVFFFLFLYMFKQMIPDTVLTWARRGLFRRAGRRLGVSVKGPGEVPDGPPHLDPADVDTADEVVVDIGALDELRKEAPPAASASPPREEVVVDIDALDELRKETVADLVNTVTTSQKSQEERMEAMDKRLTETLALNAATVQSGPGEVPDRLPDPADDPADVDAVDAVLNV